MPIGELARLRACECDKFVHVLGRHVAMDHKHARREDHQRVTVGRGLCGTLDRNIAAGAGRILDQDGFAPGLGKLVCKQPRRDVRGTAGRKTDENSNGFVRVGGLGKPVVRSEQRRQRSKEGAYELHFRFFLAPPSRRYRIESAASANEPLTSTQCSKMSTEVFSFCRGAGIDQAEESTVETSYPSPADLRSAAAECARSSTLMRASAAAKACSACPSAGITTLLTSAELASGVPLMSSAVPAARKISSAVMRRCSRASS